MAQNSDREILMNAIISRIDIKYLRSFQAVFRAGNMVNAAKKRNITQSAISKHIKSLEDLLKVHLFVRTTKGIEPTQTSIAISQDIENILIKFDNFADQTAELAAQNPQILRLASGPKGKFLAIEGIHFVKQYHPNVKVSIQTLSPEHQHHQLLRGAVDAGFTRPPVPYTLRALPLGTGKLVLAAHKSKIDALGENTRLAELLQQNILIRLYPDFDPFLHRQTDLLLSELNIAVENYQYIHDESSLLALLSSGLGVSIVTWSTTLPQNADIGYIELGGHHSQWEVSLAWNPMINNEIRDEFLYFYQHEKHLNAPL